MKKKLFLAGLVLDKVLDEKENYKSIEMITGASQHGSCIYWCSNFGMVIALT